MGEHKEFYPIDRPDASAIFLRARHVAGEYLEQQIELHGSFSYTSSGYFKWIKAELTYLSFDNFTLAYKNKRDHPINCEKTYWGQTYTFDIMPCFNKN